MILRKSIVRITAFLLVVTMLMPTISAYCQVPAYGLPQPSTVLSLSTPHNNSFLLGLRIDPADPLRLNFIVDGADSREVSPAQVEELVKYFLAGLAVPEDEIWVNLSPYEQNRIAPESLAITGLGRDMLAQDYILKQLSASLIHPDSAAGKGYWDAGKDNPLSRVWIVPGQAQVYEEGDSVVVAKATLTVKTENDYYQAKQTVADNKYFKEQIIPLIEKDVNKGKNFSQLRAIYYALILAKWFKEKAKDSFYRHYINHNKVAGIDLADKNVREKIYRLYCESFTKGVFDCIKNEKVSAGKICRRHYFAGGIARLQPEITYTTKRPVSSLGKLLQVTILLLGTQNITACGSGDSGKGNNNTVLIAGSGGEAGEGGASETEEGGNDSGGLSAQGGMLETSEGGAVSAGGATGEGGTAETADGGTTAIGGSDNGGASAQGGASETAEGGAISAGGSDSTGGTSDIGGSTGIGGMETIGGTTGEGGTSYTGGTTAQGGLGGEAGSSTGIAEELDPYLIFLRNNVSTATGLPYSFYVPEDVAEEVYGAMGGSITTDIIRRYTVAYGINIYDDACRTIALLSAGVSSDIDLVSVSNNIFWQGGFGDFGTIRAGYVSSSGPQPFIYDVDNPTAVSPYISDYDVRGYIFRMLNADGVYSPITDPGGYESFSYAVDGTYTIHWTDWKPITGENAWAQMGSLHLYKKKYYDATTGAYVDASAQELRLAQELARAALMLQAENGGVRMGPQGADNYYNLISTENNVSQYAAFRMLYQVTGETKYQEAMAKQEEYFKAVWDSTRGVFYTGMTYTNSVWELNTTDFAVDCQTWPLIVLSPAVIDTWFGEGAAYQMWVKTKELSGYYVDGILRGVGYSTESDQISPEFTRGAIVASKKIRDYYAATHSEWSDEAAGDITTMREGLDDSVLTYTALDGMADAYSLQVKYIPFGWWSLDPRVGSLASTSWRVFDKTDTDPFKLRVACDDPRGASLASYCAVLFILAAGYRFGRRGRAEKKQEQNIGGVKMAGINVYARQENINSAFNKLGPEFFSKLTFSLLKIDSVASLSAWLSAENIG